MATTLSVGDCDNCTSTQMHITNQLRLAAAKLESKTKYAYILPWTFCNADTQKGAKACSTQLRGRPLELHDEATQELMATADHLQSLTLVAEGCPCPLSWQREVDRISNSCIDESAGEGYHRGAHHTSILAPASESAYIKQSTRNTDSVKRIRKSIQTKGKRGIAVVRYEWRNWKRILQTNMKKKWRPVKDRPPKDV